MRKQAIAHGDIPVDLEALRIWMDAQGLEEGPLDNVELIAHCGERSSRNMGAISWQSAQGNRRLSARCDYLSIRTGTSARRRKLEMVIL